MYHACDRCQKTHQDQVVTLQLQEGEVLTLNDGSERLRPSGRQQFIILCQECGHLVHETIQAALTPGSHPVGQ